MRVDAAMVAQLEAIAASHGGEVQGEARKTKGLGSGFRVWVQGLIV